MAAFGGLPMKRANILLLFILILQFACVSAGYAEAGFEGTSDGVRYIVRDSSGNVVQNLKPVFDTSSGNYVVKLSERFLGYKHSLASRFLRLSRFYLRFDACSFIQLRQIIDHEADFFIKSDGWFS